jgi:hypothetical protein
MWGHNSIRTIRLNGVVLNEAQLLLHITFNSFISITFVRIFRPIKCFARYTQNAGVRLSILVKRPIFDLRQNWNVLADSSETLQYQISVVPPGR